MLEAQEKAKRVRTIGGIDLVFPGLPSSGGVGQTLCTEQGFRDGVNGLVVRVFASMYTFLKYAKPWDPSRGAVSHPEAR